MGGQGLGAQPYDGSLQQGYLIRLLSQIKDRASSEPGENHGKARAPAAAAHHDGSKSDVSLIKAPSNEPEASNGPEATSLQFGSLSKASELDNRRT